jgi:hypothetical protein
MDNIQHWHITYYFTCSREDDVSIQLLGRDSDRHGHGAARGGGGGGRGRSQPRSLRSVERQELAQQWNRQMIGVLSRLGRLL